MVEDTGLFQLLEASFLRRTGCEIVRAGNRRQMIERARHDRPDLILVDPAKLGEGGVDCIRELKEDSALRKIPLLAVTEPEAVSECSAAGADATLARPVTRADLEEALCSLGHVTKRHGKRRSARMRAQIKTTDGGQRGRVKDISCSGLFVSMPKPPPVSAPVILSLRLPASQGNKSVQARGVVVRKVEDRPESHLIPGVGVRFVEMDAATEALIDHYVQQAILGEDPLNSDTGERNDA